MSAAITELTSPAIVFGLGLLGGLLAEGVKWFKLRESNHFPEYSRSYFYWGITIVMIIVGGALAYAYSLVGSINAILAINVGASAPLIAAGLATSEPKPPEPGAPQPVAKTKPKARDFLSWH